MTFTVEYDIIIYNKFNLKNMNQRSPERRTEASDSRESQSQGPRELNFDNEQVNSISKGAITLKRGLELRVDTSENLTNLTNQLSQYAFSLMGKYESDDNLVRITEDVTLNLNETLNTNGLSFNGSVVIPQGSSTRVSRRSVVQNTDGTSTITQTVDSNTGSETSQENLTAEEVRLRTEQEQIAQQRIQEAQEQSRGDRQDLASNILSDISEIFSSDQNFIQKLSAIITLLLDKIMGGSNSQSSSNAESTDESSEEQTQEQATEAVRREFNLEQHRQSSVIDLGRNPFSPDKAPDLPTYLTYQAEGEAARKRLIIRPKESTTHVPSEFPTKTLESFKSELLDAEADADTFRESLSQPLAIESELNNPGFVSLVSVMQRFLNVDNANTSKRDEIANNIRIQYIQEGNPNSAIASKFLETFQTSG